MIMRGLFSSRIIRWIVIAPLLAVYGAFAIVRGAVRLAGRAKVTARLLSLTLVCPACGEASATRSRWSCSSCSSVYTGAVVVCEYCGARASHYPCEWCGASIPLEPWRES
jgi:predicted RNA-binding Zn-ribbon protein involved in translation (DUF1610 family)